MANDPTALVEQHLQMMTEISVEDEATAQQALAYALSAVGGMNQRLSATQQPTASLAMPVDDIVKKLENWIKRLVAKLTEIVRWVLSDPKIRVDPAHSGRSRCLVRPGQHRGCARRTFKARHRPHRPPQSRRRPQQLLALVDCWVSQMTLLGPTRRVGRDARRRRGGRSGRGFVGRRGPHTGSRVVAVPAG